MPRTPRFSHLCDMFVVSSARGQRAWPCFSSSRVNNWGSVSFEAFARAVFRDSFLLLDPCDKFMLFIGP